MGVGGGLNEVPEAPPERVTAYGPPSTTFTSLWRAL
jgi:hypothetical protein